MEHSTHEPSSVLPGELPPIPADFSPRLSPPGEVPVRRRRRRLAAGVLLGLTGLTAAGAVLVSTCTLCYAVSAGDAAPLAFVPATETYQTAVSQVEDQVSQILQEDYAYPQQTTVALTIAPKEQLQTPAQLTDRLMETVDRVAVRWLLTVDGVPVAACGQRQTIDQALEAVKDHYRTSDTTAAYFSGEIAVEEVYLPQETELLDEAGLLQRLLQPRSQVQPALDQLARACGEEEQPPETEGAALPLLLVHTEEEVTTTQPVPPAVQEIPDDTLLVGQRQTIQEGTPGLEERTERVACLLGQEQSRQTMSVNLLTPAVPTQVAVGTAQGEAGAKGRFLWPLQGRISSPFGPRQIFGGSGFHRGLDIAAPSGTPITAAAGGTVIWSGPKGTYGNLLQVDHGNGYVTYYAHCSQLLAQVGQTVAQGETIALVGSTGRSTGPHCHFELLWQGTLLDPENCLP